MSTGNDILNPFDYISAVSYSKENLIVDEVSEKGYNAFLTNRTLSYHMDAIFMANEANRFGSDISNKMQYDFYLNILPKKKRYAKWSKEVTTDKVASIMEYYKCSRAKAIEYASILDDDALEMINTKNEKGGLNGKPKKTR